MYAYLDAVRLKFIENGQEQTVNVSPENLELFLKAHPDYVIVSTEKVRNFFALD